MRPPRRVRPERIARTRVVACTWGRTCRSSGADRGSAVPTACASRCVLLVGDRSMSDRTRESLPGRSRRGQHGCPGARPPRTRVERPQDGGARRDRGRSRSTARPPASRGQCSRWDNATQTFARPRQRSLTVHFIGDGARISITRVPTPAAVSTRGQVAGFAQTRMHSDPTARFRR